MLCVNIIEALRSHLRFLLFKKTIESYIYICPITHKKYVLGKVIVKLSLTGRMILLNSIQARGMVLGRKITQPRSYLVPLFNNFSSYRVWLWQEIGYTNLLLAAVSASRLAGGRTVSWSRVRWLHHNDGLLCLCNTRLLAGRKTSLWNYFGLNLG